MSTRYRVFFKLWSGNCFSSISISSTLKAEVSMNTYTYMRGKSKRNTKKKPKQKQNKTKNYLAPTLHQYLTTHPIPNPQVTSLRISFSRNSLSVPFLVVYLSSMMNTA